MRPVLVLPLACLVLSACDTAPTDTGPSPTSPEPRSSSAPPSLTGEAIPFILFTVGATHNDLIENRVGPGLYSYTTSTPRPYPDATLYQKAVITTWQQLRTIPEYAVGMADTAHYRSLFYTPELLNETDPDVARANADKGRRRGLRVFDSLRVAYSMSPDLTKILNDVDWILSTDAAYTSSLARYRDSVLQSSAPETIKNFTVLITSLGTDSQTYWTSWTETQALADQTSVVFVLPWWAALDLAGCAVGGILNLRSQKNKTRIDWEDFALNCLGWGVISSLGGIRPAGGVLK